MVTNYLKLNRRQKENILIGFATIAVLALAIYLFILTGPHPLPNGPPEFQFNIYGPRGNNLSGPLGVATETEATTPPFGIINPLPAPGQTGKQEKIFVANTGKGLIQIYDYQGNLLKSFAVSRNKKKNTLVPSYPIDLSLNAQENIYVATNSPYLSVFNNKGKFLHRLPRSKSKAKGTFLTRPIGTYLARNRVYVIDGMEHKVKVFDLSGKLILQFGEMGDKPGQFKYPDSIVVDEQGKMYVTDSGNARLQIFNQRGRLLSVIGSSSQAPFVLPRGLAIDPWQRIHVVDTFAQQVHVLDRQGRYLFSYGSGRRGSADGEFDFPNGIAIDQKTGRIFIADRANNRISIWDYPN